MSRKLIALDAGHGKNTYPPSKGVPSMPEFEFNSAVVGYTIAHFERNGFDVLLTQPLDGNDTPLLTRTNLANNRKADLLLSFHADANVNKDARGHWGFYWHTSKDGKRFADIWYDELLKVRNGEKFRNNQPCVPGTWTNLHMVRETKMIAVLMEHGFMTNVHDLALLKADDFRRKCAEAACKAVCRYYGQTYKEVPKPVAEQVKSTPVIKEQPFMFEKAIVINSFADYPAVERLANKLNLPVYTRTVAEKTQVAKELIICGGYQGKLKSDKFTDLSGKTLFDTYENIAKFMK